VSPAADLLVDWLRRPRFEVIPFEGVEDEVLRHVPARLPVTVSASPTRALEPTLVLCERLVAHGYRAVPQLVARLVADRTQLRDVLERIHDVGVREACMSGGSSPDLQPPPNRPRHLGDRRPRRTHEYGGNVTQSALYIIALCRFGAHAVGRRARGSRTTEEPIEKSPANPGLLLLTEVEDAFS
jgi:hypothetical protein